MAYPSQRLYAKSIRGKGNHEFFYGFVQQSHLNPEVGSSRRGATRTNCEPNIFQCISCSINTPTDRLKLRLNSAPSFIYPPLQTVLHVCIHAIGKGGRRRDVAMATTINRCLMLCNLRARHRYVKNLTPLHPLDHPHRQAILTGATGHSLMSVCKVRLCFLT